jgi:hypothetical protein
LAKSSCQSSPLWLHHKIDQEILGIEIRVFLAFGNLTFFAVGCVARESGKSQPALCAFILDQTTVEKNQIEDRNFTNSGKTCDVQPALIQL